MNSAEQQFIDQAYRATWATFVAAARIEPAFEARSNPETLHLVFLCPVDASPDVAARVAPIQERLAFPDVDLVPPENLHVSIQGFDVEQAEWAERREEVLRAARSVFARVPAFTLRLGWPNSFPMAAFLCAEDGGIIRSIRAELRRALPEWAGLDRDPLVRGGQDEWLPHMSLGYYNAHGDNRALVEAIAPVRGGVIAEAVVREIHLISTPPDLAGAGRWEWPVQAVFELGAP